MGTLDGRGVLVTGWSRGIGRAIVTRLAGDGASVVFSYLQDQDSAERSRTWWRRPRCAGSASLGWQL